MDENATAVIHQAERIINQASWRLLEETALRALAGTNGLGLVPLEPRSDVIQLVTYDGQHLGHVRREGSPDLGDSWLAVPCKRGRLSARYPTAAAAARALAVAAARLPPDS